MYPLTEPTHISTALAVILAAALLHASFQLSGSVMTRMSSHTIGGQKSHRRLLHLCVNYMAGNVIGISLLGLALAYLVSGTRFPPVEVLWTIVSGIGIATAMLLFWYNVHNRSRGHWLPIGASIYLYERASKTKRGFESFSLGVMTAFGEVPFVLAPLLLVAMVLHGQPDPLRIGVVISYALIASLPLLITFVAVGSGVKVSRIEQWRDSNHYFLTGACAVGLLVLSLYAFSLYAANINGDIR